MAESGVPADFGVHRLDAALDAVRAHQPEIYGVRAGSDPARGCPPVVRAWGGLGVIPRSMAIGGIRGVCGGTFSAESHGTKVAEGLHRILGAAAPAHAGKKQLGRRAE